MCIRDSPRPFPPSVAACSACRENLRQRRTESAAQDFARRHNVPKFYTELDDLLNDPEVDAVYVATPPGTHKELALRVCAAGKPCYMEKPMAR